MKEVRQLTRSGTKLWFLGLALWFTSAVAPVLDARPPSPQESEPPAGGDDEEGLAPVPEPSTLFLVGSGFVGFALYQRRKRHGNGSQRRADGRPPG